jgi:hypothetical protein
MNDQTNAAFSTAGEPETPLCLGCLTPYLPEAHFCAKCGAPLSSYAATGPFERLFAEGHVYRQAAEQPRRFVVVAGVWLIFGPVGLAALALIFMGSRDGVVPLIGGGFLLAISLAMLWRTTRAYVTRPRPTSAEDQ